MASATIAGINLFTKYFYSSVTYEVEFVDTSSMNVTSIALALCNGFDEWDES